MHRPPFLRLFLMSSLFLAAGLARADVPRDPSYVPSCTAEKAQQAGGGPCEECRMWRDPDPCQEALAAKGYTKRCTEGGAGSFVAVWCKEPAAASSSTPGTVKPSSSRCAAGGSPAEGAGWAVLGAVGVLVAGVRRRRR